MHRRGEDWEDLFTVKFWGNLYPDGGLAAKCKLGAWQLENLISGLEAFSMAIFTRILGCTKLEVDIFLGDVKKEMKDTKIHVY